MASYQIARPSEPLWVEGRKTYKCRHRSSSGSACAQIDLDALRRAGIPAWLVVSEEHKDRPPRLLG